MFGPQNFMRGTLPGKGIRYITSSSSKWMKLFQPEISTPLWSRNYRDLSRLPRNYGARDTFHETRTWNISLLILRQNPQSPHGDHVILRLKSWYQFILRSLKLQVYSNVNKPKTKHFDFLQQRMPAASQGARRMSVTRAACWPYAMPRLSHTLLGLFFYCTKSIGHLWRYYLLHGLLKWNQWLRVSGC